MCRVDLDVGDVYSCNAYRRSVPALPCLLIAAFAAGAKQPVQNNGSLVGKRREFCRAVGRSLGLGDFYEEK
jgi:hypothetical protein